MKKVIVSRMLTQALFITNSADGTKDLAKNLVRDILMRGTKTQAVIVALEGDLGSGKTTFAQGLAKGLGVKENITSPTFVLMKKYKITSLQPSSYIRGGRRERLGQGARFRLLFHIDCYRIEKSWQLQELGFEEIISDPENIVVIEWAEKIAEILPKNKITIKFEFMDENKRKIIFDQGLS